MINHEVFNNAPITEALLDIRIETLSNDQTLSLEGLYEAVKNDYPEKDTRYNFKGEIKLQPTFETLPTQQILNGFFFKNNQLKQLWQARRDGFTFNKLKPYEKWESFRDEARRLAEIFFSATQPMIITRIALRYINKIHIPLPINDFKEYVLTSAEVAPGLPQGISSFFLNVVYFDPTSQANVIINETIEPPENEILPLIFDIDVSYDIKSSYNDSVWAEFEKLRKVKNEVFFNSITSKARDLFR